MDAGSLSLVVVGLALLAGLLTTLSPCVLPVLPMVAASATSRSRWGLPAMALGIATTFTLVGVTLARSGSLLGLDDRMLRLGAGVLMALLGAALLVPAAQRFMEAGLQRVGSFGGNAAARVHSDHPAAQLGIGVLMGVAWSPCVGPTLGAAIGLAASGGSASSAAAVMAVFSLGAVLPLMAVGLLGRSLLVRHRARLAQAGDVGRKLMGGSLLVVGVLVLTGLDKALEAWLLGLAPTWLVELTTRF